MPEAENTDTTKVARSYSIRAERSLKDVDRLLKGSSDTPAHERGMAQVEQAKVWALLDLADAIRENQNQRT